MYYGYDERPDYEMAYDDDFMDARYDGYYHPRHEREMYYRWYYPRYRRHNRRRFRPYPWLW